MLAKNAALRALVDAHLDTLCREEGLDPQTVLHGIETGTMVLLGNPAHARLRPLLVGQPSRIKVNANLGSSPLSHCPETEARKLAVALQAGADTVMDLSIAGDLDALRLAMLEHCPLPVGTVPMYAVGQQLLDNGREIGAMTPDMLFDEIAKQAKQGVDFMTVHCGLTRRGAGWGDEQAAPYTRNNDQNHAPYARNSDQNHAPYGRNSDQNHAPYGRNSDQNHAPYGRVMGIVSRGGAMLARWMLEHDRENPLLEGFDRILDLALEYNVTLSLGDGLRPGAGCDAGDAAQWDEVIMLGQLARRAHEAGVQAMIEGPGHVPLHEVEAQIRGIKRLTHGAPLYVLGPLTVDSAAGHDHIAGAIGGALGVQAGVDFLCYLTPAEHLTLPDEADVHAGVMASRVAAHAGEVALGTPRALAREAAMNSARRALDWEGMSKAALDPAALEKRREAHRHEEVCAMCGKFCAVKMLRDKKTNT